MNMQYNKTFYASLKSLVKKTNKFGQNQANNVNDLYNVSLINETPLFFAYQHRESLQFNKFNNQVAVIPFNAPFLVKTFVTFATTSFVNNNSSFTFKGARVNTYCFSYCLFFIQLLGLFGTYKAKEFSNNVSSSYFAYRFILKYLSGQTLNAPFKFTRRERFLYQSVLFSISQTNQFRGVTPAFVNLLNKLFITTKQKPFVTQTKRRNNITKFVFFSVTNHRRNPLYTKRLAKSFNKVAISSRFSAIKVSRKQFANKKAGNQLITSYPRRYEGFSSKVKKAKKVKKTKAALFDSASSLVSIQGSSGFQKSQYVEIKPYSYTLKLFATNQNKGQTSYYGFNRLKSLLTLIYGNRLSLYTINARTLSRFAFDKELYGDYSSALVQAKSSVKPRVKTSYRFLRSLERERLSRFRYVAVYIQDLIRICFFSIFLKKSAFLVSFFAFTLSKLPRNRKETQFLRFLRKLVKVFASQRKEVIGIRIRFQGRVNR